MTVLFAIVDICMQEWKFGSIDLFFLNLNVTLFQSRTELKDKIQNNWRNEFLL